jgi:hypothetical protein
MKKAACFGMTLLLFATACNRVLIVQNSKSVVEEQPRMAISPSANLNLRTSDLRFTVDKMIAYSQDAPRVIDSVWINYASIIEQASTNTVSANIVSSNLPPQVIIRLRIEPYVGNGIGQAGTPTSPIILSTNPQPIIKNIGSCHPGNAVREGHLLEYSWGLTPDSMTGQLNLSNNDTLWVRVLYTLNNDE